MTQESYLQDINLEEKLIALQEVLAAESVFLQQRHYGKWLMFWQARTEQATEMIQLFASIQRQLADPNADNSELLNILKKHQQVISQNQEHSVLREKILQAYAKLEMQLNQANSQDFTQGYDQQGNKVINTKSTISINNL